MKQPRLPACILALAPVLFAAPGAAGDDPLPSWNEGATRGAIIDFVRASPIGRLDKALDEAKARGWTVADMKRDWKTIFTPLKAR